MSTYPKPQFSADTGTVQGLICALQNYWLTRGCVIQQAYDMEMGAATFHPATFLRALGPEPWRVAYVQPSRRPTDGRYGDNPNRLQHYYQFQVLLKPSPDTVQDDYLNSLQVLGIDPLQHDVRFIEDDWESPVLGAWGLGWEVWLDGMEISQFTYFQQIGGLNCQPIAVELTYGLERIAMVLQDVDDIFDLIWAHGEAGAIRYADLHQQPELEMSHYNFELANTDMLFDFFDRCETECQQLIAKKLSLPAYEMVLKSSHIFNLLDARRAISVTERQHFILRVRRLATQVAQTYYDSRKDLDFPLLRKAVAKS